VQHGDYAEAVRVIDGGEPEPYFAMGYAVGVLRALFGTGEHLVISLNAPAYDLRQGRGQLVGLPKPRLVSGVPETVAMVVWAGQVRRLLARFRPTHVLLRTSGILAWHVLRYCVRRRVIVQVSGSKGREPIAMIHGITGSALFANRFDETGLKERFVNRRLARLLNHPSVFLVGNHKQPATDTLRECGVDPAKLFPWDWPNARHPRDWPVKTVRRGDAWRIAYAGAITEAKGVGDLIDATTILSSQGCPVRVTAVGDGPDLVSMRARAGALPPGAVELPGRVGNDEAFRLMLESTLVCVPSRHEFPEGLPLSLTEALASRTPVVASDHPVFTRAFADGEGMRLFPARTPAALATVIRELLEHPEAYESLSRTTADAFRRVECTTSFGDLVERWRATFPPAAASQAG